MKKAIILGCMMFSVLYAVPALQDVVYLKNGSIIRGTIMEQIPNESMKVETVDGSLFVYNMKDVLKITKEPPRAMVPQGINADSSSIKYDSLKIEMRQNTDLQLFLTAYGITNVGALAIGVTKWEYLLIPVVGPILQLSNIPSGYSYALRDTALCLVSAAFQAWFVFDYFSADEEKKALNKKALSIFPTLDGFAIQYACML